MSDLARDVDKLFSGGIWEECPEITEKTKEGDMATLARFPLSIQEQFIALFKRHKIADEEWGYAMDFWSKKGEEYRSALQTQIEANELSAKREEYKSAEKEWKEKGEKLRKAIAELNEFSTEQFPLYFSEEEREALRENMQGFMEEMNQRNN